MILSAVVAAVALVVMLVLRRVVDDRRLRRRLQVVKNQAPAFDPASVNIENLASLAVASHLAAQETSGGWRRRLAALIGGVGIVGWTSAVAAGASAGLAATGNLPDPVQQVVADVLEGFNVEIPAPDEDSVDDDPELIVPETDVEDPVDNDPELIVPENDVEDSDDAPSNSDNAPGNGNSDDPPGNGNGRA